MPIINVNVWEGFGNEKTKTVIQEITKVFVDLGIPEQAVEVIVQEIPKTHWGFGGGACLWKIQGYLLNRRFEIIALR